MHLNGPWKSAGASVVVALRAPRNLVMLIRPATFCVAPPARRISAKDSPSDRSILRARAVNGCLVSLLEEIYKLLRLFYSASH